MAVLGVELHVAVAVQKHQLEGRGEKEMVHLKSCVVKNVEKVNEVWFDIHGNVKKKHPTQATEVLSKEM